MIWFILILMLLSTNVMAATFHGLLKAKVVATAGSEVDGKIKKVLVAPNSFVEQGQAIMIIRVDAANIAFNNYLYQYLQAKQDMLISRQRLTDHEYGVKYGFTPRKTHLYSKLNHNKAALSLGQTRYQLWLYEMLLSPDQNIDKIRVDNHKMIERLIKSSKTQTITLHATKSGIIQYQHDFKPGDFISARETLFRLSDPEQAFIEAYVTPDIATELYKGMSITVSHQDHCQAQATIDSINPFKSNIRFNSQGKLLSMVKIKFNKDNDCRNLLGHILMLKA